MSGTAAEAGTRTARLRAGSLSATVEAGRLLQVRSLADAGEELLVGAGALPPEGRVHGVAAGITLLHPWANRLGGDRYAVAGHAVDVREQDGAVGRDAAGLPLHGLLAPPGAWALEPDGTGAGVRARLAHDPAHGAAFPFAHEVEVELALRADALAVATTVRATGRDPVPLAFGWHPYLRPAATPRAGWRLALPASVPVALDARGLPVARRPRAGAQEAPLAARALDDALEGLADGAELAIAAGGRRLAVRLLEGYPAAQVYAPPAVDVVSLEPMAAPVDALRSGAGLRLLAPGAEAVARFELRVR